MIKGERVVAVVPAAGLGTRFGSERNKPLFELLGKPLLIWTLEALQGVEEIAEIIPVLKGEDISPGAALIERYGITKVKRIIPGGKERQDSVYNGLKALDGKASVVVIHDGARPLADGALIGRTIAGLEDFDGVVAAVPVKDTIKEGRLRRYEDGTEGEEIVVRRTLDRSVLWAVQTPQTFRVDKIRHAHEKARADGYYATDDAALVEKSGGTIRVVEGSYRNIKVTTPEDAIVAEALLKANSKFQTPNSKQIPDPKQVPNSESRNSNEFLSQNREQKDTEPYGKPFDLGLRTLKFAKDVVTFSGGLPRTLQNSEMCKQLVRSAGSVGANYIEANESLSKKDFLMRIKICRKEAKESGYWLKLVSCDSLQESDRGTLLRESVELTKIFSAIVEKSKG